MPKTKQTNCLLVRRPIGKVKPTTYTLPPEDFCYGKVEKIPDHGNLLAWNVPEKQSRPSRSKQQKPYDENTVFGRPTPPTSSLASVITNQYQRDWIAEQRKLQAAQLAAATRKRGDSRGATQPLRPPRNTAASLGHTKPREPSSPQPLFKMKRFQDVPSRVRLGNLPLSAAGQSIIQGQSSSAITTSFGQQQSAEQAVESL